MRKTIQSSNLLNELKRAAFFWEAWILLALMLMVVGIAARGPSSLKIPTSLASLEPYQREKMRRDPYGIRAEPDTAESRRKVETGL